jgi:hypothetical protein
MSYTPATKLSYNDTEECATVLTSGMVMITKGLGRGTMMKLEDWLILADGREQQEYIPLSKTEEPPPNPVEGTKPPVTDPFHLDVSTKMKWVLSPETYRVAVQTANGILQVKSVTDGGGEIDRFGPLAQYGRYPLLKKHFPTYTDWLRSLPLGGKTTITLPMTAIQKRSAIPSHLSDVEKVAMAERNFKMRSQIYESPSRNAMTPMLKENLTRLTREYLESRCVANPELVRRLRYSQKAYAQHMKAMEGMTEAERNEVRYFYLQRGCGKLWVRCNDNSFRVASHKGMIVRDDGKAFKTFAEMGALEFWAKYRNRVIDL